MLTRRAFIRTSTAAALTLASSPSPFAQPTAPAPSPRTSVMLWALAKFGTLEQRLSLVAQAGFRHVELVDEFRTWSEADWTRILARLRTLNLSVDAMTGLKTGFANPAGGDAFLAELTALIPVAHRLQNPQIILLSGPLLPGIAEDQQHQASVDTLRRAADLLAREDLVGVIEPIDRLENPTIWLDGVTEAFHLTRAVASPHLRVLYDLYHEQRTHGNLIEKLEANLDQVGLIHVADVPGRHQPGTGEINYTDVYRTLARLHYTGIVAMEFYPTAEALETLRSARLAAEHSLSGA